MCLRYIFYLQKEAFFGEKIDLITELQHGKDSLVFHVIAKYAITAITGVALRLKETFLKTWNSFRDSSGSLIVRLYIKVLNLNKA